MDSPQAIERGRKFKEDNAAVANGVKAARKRREYNHTMTEREKFALQVVLKAKSAMATVAVHIQEGKGCTPEVLQAALNVQAAAASVLFA
jgi:hypothetical protein